MTVSHPIKKVVEDEVKYSIKKFDRIVSTLDQYVSPKKLRLISFYGQWICQLLIHSRSGLSNYEKSSIDFKVKELFGSLQMQALKYSNKKRFSFQFRNWDQANLYPILKKETLDNNLEKNYFLLAIDYFRRQPADQRRRIEYLAYTELDKRSTRTYKVSSINENAIYVNALFSKRIGRKFVFNSLFGINSSFEPRISKLGTPNFLIDYSAKGKAIIKCALTAQKLGFTNDGLLYSPKDRKSEITKSKFLTSNLRYLIGVDRGENTLLCITVYDLLEKKVVESKSLGESFKEKVDLLKKEQAALQASFKNKARLKYVTKKISNIIDSEVIQATNELIKIASLYSEKSIKDDLHTGLVFEHLSSSFKRTGAKAYVELNQMHKALKRIKESRNYYGLKFHIFEIGPSWTSQICSACGHIEANNRSKESFLCMQCGHKDHADLQASLNIALKWLSKKDYLINEIEDKSAKEYFSEYIKDLDVYRKAG